MERLHSPMRESVRRICVVVFGCLARRPQSDTLDGSNFSDVAVWQRHLREYIRLNGLTPNPQVLVLAGRA